MDLQQDKISAVIIADVSGNAYLENMKGLKKVDIVIDSQPGASIAFRKGEPDLVKAVNEAILKLRDDGTYLQLLEKYFPERAEEFKETFKK